MSAPLRFGRYLYARVNEAIFGATEPAPTTEDEEPRASLLMYEPGQFEPFLADVLEVKNDLFTGLKIPMELVDAILDLAEYWPHTTAIKNNGEKLIRTGRGRPEDEFVLRSWPLGYQPKYFAQELSFPILEPDPWKTTKDHVESTATDDVRAKWLEQSQMKSEYPCRKIVFTIKSHDQGWGSRPEHKGTYVGSYTWFEVGKEELVAFKRGEEPSTIPSMPDTIDGPHTLAISDPPVTCAFHTILPPTESNQTSSDDTDIEYHFKHAFEPNEKTLQKNVTAEKNMQTHKIVWSCDDNIDPDSVSGKELDDIGRGRATATGEFVRNMKIGDVVTVWGKARFAAWCNTIDEVKIDVYWAV